MADIYIGYAVAIYMWIGTFLAGMSTTILLQGRRPVFHIFLIILIQQFFWLVFLSFAFSWVKKCRS